MNNNNEREVYYKGKRIDNKALPYWLENKLNTILDDFEDGQNAVVDGYEVLQHGAFMIKRKCQQ
jgi:hypothetical protein